MKLTYETGIATLIQFLLLSLLNIVNGFFSTVSSCHNDGKHCVSNVIAAISFFILISCWFGFVWALGFLAQERRSKILARLLILTELAIAAVAFFSIKHNGGILSVFISCLDLGLTLWIITLAYRLSKSSGGRIVAKQRPRQRKRPVDKL